MDKIFQIATRISTPVALGGFLAAVFFFLAQQIIAKDIFPKLSEKLGSALLMNIIDKAFVLALVAMVLGFAGYALRFIPRGSNRRIDILSLQQAWQGIRAPDPQKLDVDMTHRALNSMTVTARFWRDANADEKRLIHDECWSPYRQWFVALDSSRFFFSDRKPAKTHLDGLLREVYEEMKSYG